MLKNGYIKLHRRMLDWEWYHDVNTKVVFLHLLLTANIKDEKWKGEEIKRGSRVISYPILADELNLTIRQARTALEHLKMTGEVTVKTTAKYSVVTVLNYNRYQGATGNLTGKRQANDTIADSQATGNRQQYKKNKEEKEKEEDIGASPTPSILQSFISENRLNVDAEKFFDYYERFNWKDKNGRTIDWRDKLKSWDAREMKPKPAYQTGYAGIRNLADDD